MKSARDCLERKRLEKMRQATKKSLSAGKWNLCHFQHSYCHFQLRPHQGHHRRAKALESVSTSKPENALEEKTVNANTRRLRKAKEVRKANLDPVQEPESINVSWF